MKNFSMKYSRPRGRARKNHEWDHQYGVWKPTERSTLFNIYTMKVRCRPTKIYRTNEFAKLETFTEIDDVDIEETDEQTPENDNARLSRVKAENEARIFMYPCDTAHDIYRSTRGKVHCYWLDAKNGFYQCPHNPYKDNTSPEKSKEYIIPVSEIVDTCDDVSHEMKASHQRFLKFRQRMAEDLEQREIWGDRQWELKSYKPLPLTRPHPVLPQPKLKSPQQQPHLSLEVLSENVWAREQSDSESESEEVALQFAHD